MAKLQQKERNESTAWKCAFYTETSAKRKKCVLKLKVNVQLILFSQLFNVHYCRVFVHLLNRTGTRPKKCKSKEIQCNSRLCSNNISHFTSYLWWTFALDIKKLCVILKCVFVLRLLYANNCFRPSNYGHMLTEWTYRVEGFLEKKKQNDVSLAWHHFGILYIFS